MNYIEETLILSKDENESGSENYDDFRYSAATYRKKLTVQVLESKMAALRGRINSVPVKPPPKVFGHAIDDSGRSSYLDVAVREHLDGHAGYVTQNDIRASRSRIGHSNIREEFISLRPKAKTGRQSMWETIKEKSKKKSQIPAREQRKFLYANRPVQRKRPPKVIFGRRLADNRRMSYLPPQAQKVIVEQDASKEKRSTAKKAKPCVQYALRMWKMLKPG